MERPHGMPGRTKWALLGFLAIAGFLLFTEHRAHVLGVLPYLLLLACPLMHLLHGHGGHGHAKHSDTGDGAGDAALDRPGTSGTPS